jgi:hypothetical protein
VRNVRGRRNQTMKTTRKVVEGSVSLFGERQMIVGAVRRTCGAWRLSHDSSESWDRWLRTVAYCDRSGRAVAVGEQELDAVKTVEYVRLTPHGVRSRARIVRRDREGASVERALRRPPTAAYGGWPSHA